MSVNYSVVFKDGKKGTRDAVCFGSMAGGSFSFLSSELRDRPASEQAFIQFNVGSHIHPIWSVPMPQFCREWQGRNLTPQQATGAFLEEMKLLLADLPVYSKVLTVHPLLKVVRAHVKDNEADRIITALFMIRNLANYSDMAGTYRFYRHRGYRPRLCLIIAHTLGYNVGSFSNASYSHAQLGEYNWINPQNFGKNAFLRLMRHTDDTGFDFIQDPWTEQCGYRRDNYYRDPRNSHYLVFDDRYVNGGWDQQAQSVIPNSVRSGDSILKTRNIVDCFSISGDEPIGEWHTWNPCHGFLWKHPESQVNQSFADGVLSQMIAVCEENGIPTTL